MTLSFKRITLRGRYQGCTGKAHKEDENAMELVGCDTDTFKAHH